MNTQPQNIENGAQPVRPEIDRYTTVDASVRRVAYAIAQSFGMAEARNILAAEHRAQLGITDANLEQVTNQQPNTLTYLPPNTVQGPTAENALS
jgi:hypothetical protein